MSERKDLGRSDWKYRRSSNLALATGVRNSSKDLQAFGRLRQSKKKNLNSASESKQSLLLGRAVSLLIGALPNWCLGHEPDGK